jgi:hypothetical protein
MVAASALHLALGRKSHESVSKVVMKLRRFPPTWQRSSSRVIPHQVQAAPSMLFSRMLTVSLYSRWSSARRNTRQINVRGITRLTG